MAAKGRAKAERTLRASPHRQGRLGLGFLLAFQQARLHRDVHELAQRPGDFQCLVETAFLQARQSQRHRRQQDRHRQLDVAARHRIAPRGIEDQSRQQRCQAQVAAELQGQGQLVGGAK
jgi:hypothetical protein